MKLLLFLLIILNSGCSRTPEEELIHLLETRYANLHVNRPEHKRAVLEKLKMHLTAHRLKSTNFSGIRDILREMNDGHLQLRNENKKPPALFSGIQFLPGTSRIHSCATCIPALPVSDYTIVSINQLPIKDWQEFNHLKVSASTQWGRQHRLSRLLESTTSAFPLQLEVMNKAGKIFKTNADWSIKNPKDSRCVTGHRVNDSTYQITVTSLWCPPTERSQRSDAIQFFKLQWEETIASVQTHDKIILDLRENGGGGDEETIHVLSTFLDRPVPLFHYQYLQTTRPGLLKYLAHYTHDFWPLWAEEKKEQLNPTHVGKTLNKQKLEVLIGPGCFSSCEVVADVLKNAQRGELIGATTHGGAGDPRDFPIKGTGYVITIPTCLLRKTAGGHFEGEGVKPDKVHEF